MVIVSLQSKLCSHHFLWGENSLLGYYNFGNTEEAIFKLRLGGKRGNKIVVSRKIKIDPTTKWTEEYHYELVYHMIYKRDEANF